MKANKDFKTLYVAHRAAWRAWLEEHFETDPEIWLVFPNKASNEPSLLYNDAVEEALCFGWIDSTVKNLDEMHKIQWFLDILVMDITLNNFEIMKFWCNLHNKKHNHLILDYLKIQLCYFS
jgi:hypothetical protein